MLQEANAGSYYEWSDQLLLYWSNLKSSNQTKPPQSLEYDNLPHFVLYYFLLNMNFFRE